MGNETPKRPWDRQHVPSRKQRVRETRRRFRAQIGKGAGAKPSTRVPFGLLALAILIGGVLGSAITEPGGALRLTAGTSAANIIIGRASVVDGDTLEIHGERIRLNGIDAPESRQTCEDAAGQPYRCGQAAALALSDHIGSQLVGCRPQGHDRYGRTIAKCATGGEDLGGWLVRQGYAVDYLRYSRGAYAWPQLQARRERLGIWSGTFTNPEDWRHGQRD